MTKKNLHSFSLWKKIILLFFLGILALVGLFIYGIVTDQPPKFFSLDDPQGEYTITKNCPDARGWEEQSQYNNSGDAYCLEYKGNHVLWIDASNPKPTFFRIPVGNSTIDLAPLVGKQVRNVKGKFVSSSKQCIQEKCTSFNGSIIALNIDTLEKTQNATKKAVELFTNGQVHNLTFTAQYESTAYGDYVDEYKDEYKAIYQVDIKTNKVVFFLAYGIADYPKERTTIITPEEAEKIGLAFAKENIHDFENYTKNAEYSFSQETASKMLTKYNFGWITKKEDKDGKLRPFHTAMALDEYGNVIIFQSEFADSG